MKKIKKVLVLALTAMSILPVSAQTVKLNGVYENNRYDDSDMGHSQYVGWNSDLQKAIFIVDNGLYTMTWDGTSLTDVVKEPPVLIEDFYSEGRYTDNNKALWANNFNLMVGNSGAAYVNGKIVCVQSRDEQSTTDDELFAVTKWDAKTGNLISREIRPKADCLESAGMSYNPKDGKVYGLFYLTNQKLSEAFTNDPDFFVDEDGESSDEDAGYCICSIDLKTMKIIPITPGLYYQNFITFAINSEGRAFALSSGGGAGYVDDEGKTHNITGQLTGAQLYEFDLATGLMKTKDVESFDPATGEAYTERVSIYDHATGYPSQYRRQAACFSKSNPNIMYWVGYYNSGKGINDWGSWTNLSDKEWRTNGKYDTSLYAVDITTGDATRLVEKIPNRYVFSCLWADGDDSSDDSDVDPLNPINVEPDDGNYIILASAENGSIWQKVEMGQSYTYFLEPDKGWKLHSVSFNGADYTNEVTGNNMFTTPNISRSQSTLYVTFELDDTTDVDRVTSPVSQVRILGMAGGIRITHANVGDQVQVYSIDGRLLQSQQLTTSQTIITLRSKHFYIVKVGNKTVKVRL